MRPTFSLIKREFTAYFLSPIAYVVLTVFLLGTGGLYWWTVEQLTTDGPRGVEFPLGVILGDGSEGISFPIFWLVFLFVPPLLTMRLFAEERGTGTMEMLMTAPVRDWQIVFAKFVGCFAFYVLMWLPTLLYIPMLTDLHATWDENGLTSHCGRFLGGLGLVAIGILMMPAGWVGRGFVLAIIGTIVAVVFGYAHYTKDTAQFVRFSTGIDPWPVLTSYIGVLAAGSMFLALGLFVSSLVKGQMVAALLSITLGMPLMIFVLFLPNMDPSDWTYRVAAFVTVPHHFGRDFTRGVLDTRHLVFYVSAALLLLFLTVRSVESLRR